MPTVQATGDAAHEENALHDLVSALRRRIAVLLVVSLALPAGALLYSLSAEKQYTATAKLLFRDPGFDQKALGGSSPVLGPSVDPAREAATNVGLVSLDTVAKRAADTITTRRLTAQEIGDKVVVSSQGQSNVVAVRATDASPAFAATLANTIARQYIVFRRDADRSKINQAVGLLQERIGEMTPRQREAEGSALRKQVEGLQLLAALQTGNAELVQPADAPRSASSPKTMRNAILGLVIGVALGLGLALLLDRLDRRLRTREDAEALLGRPVLGAIPESRSLGADSGEALHLGGAEAEAFRSLRANLRYYDIDREIRSLLVTSSAPGEGKSTVARYLAATAAAVEVSVILVEADLRRPTLNALYSSLDATGLSDVLSDQASLDATIQRLPISVASVAEDRTLDVICAGSAAPNPTDLLESEHMRTVLAELQTRYELVIVDSSPVTVVPDSVPLLSQVSGVLVVMRESKTTSVGTRTLRDQLAHMGISPLGLVMNGTAQTAGAGYHGYYAYAAAGADGSRNGAQVARRGLGRIGRGAAAAAERAGRARG